MAVTADLAKVLDKAYEETTLTELVDAPVAALADISDGDAQIPDRPGPRRAAGLIPRSSWLSSLGGRCPPRAEDRNPLSPGGRLHRRLARRRPARHTQTSRGLRAPSCRRAERAE